MKIFVAGGTGVVGRTAVPALVRQGHDVTVVARTPAKAELVRSWGAEPVEVDLFDPTAVKAAVAGHDVVVNLATSIPPLSKAARPKAWATNDRLRREASRNLVDAALAAGAGRYVQESIAFLYADAGQDWITEESPLAANPNTASALDAEAQAGRFAAAGGTAVVLRFGAFYGPENSQTAAMLRLARRGFGMVPGARDAYVSPIRTEDAAAAVVVAATDAPGGIYNVVDDEPLTRQAFDDDALAAAVGRTRLRPVPKVAVRLMGEKLDHLTRSHRVSNRALRAATGWAPRYPSAREGLAALVSEGPAVDVGVALGEPEAAVEPVRRLP
ncbi:MAG: NAD(P)-dependent oxidoreductase [Actinomycetota bacterium]|nr:NAD(P)-dependent oxidoreductase [Actinomycetota bacterium]